MKNFPEELIIKKRIVQPFDFAYICIVILYTFFFKDLGKQAIGFLFIGIIIVYPIFFVLRFKKRTTHIIINKQGINLCKEKKIYNWGNIQYAYPKQIGKAMFLFIKTKTDEIHFHIGEMNYPHNSFSEYLEFYSGRKIDKKTHELDILESVGLDKSNSSIINDKFKRTHKKQAIVALGTLFPLIGFSIYLQYQTKSPFALFLGFISTLYIIFKWNNYIEKRFRETPIVSTIREEEYLQLAYKYGIKTSPRELRGVMIFFGVVALCILVISTLVIYDII